MILFRDGGEEILDFSPLPPIYPFKTTILGPGPVRSVPGSKKGGSEGGSKTPRNP